MNVTVERGKLDAAITSLKQELDAVDLNAISDSQEVQRWLDKIDAVYVQVKQFISRFGDRGWNSWGPARWNDIARNEAALKRKLIGQEREEMRRSNAFNKRMAYLSALFAAISAIAAIFSAYSGCTPASQRQPAASGQVSEKAPNNALKSDRGDAARPAAP